MKKLWIFLLLGIALYAQPYNQQDVVSTNTMNSNVTALDSAGVFTGKAEAVLYTSAITVLIRSDVGGTGSAQFSSDGTHWDLKEPFTYTASDSLTKYMFNVQAKYFRVIYTNSGTDQTYFRLQTIYHKTALFPITGNRLDFNLSPAASDTAHQDQIISELSLLKTTISNATSAESFIVEPYHSYLSVRDSVVGIDTAVYNFSVDGQNLYKTCYVSIYNSNVSTPDTLVIENYSEVKVGYTSSEIGMRNLFSGSLESDNTSIILAASTTKTYEINFSRPNIIRVRPKTLTGRTSAKKVYVGFKGTN